MTAAVGQFQVHCPEPFTFSTPSEWPKWRKRFERFMRASGLCSKTEDEQINTLIYIMGSQAEDILLSFALNDNDSKKFGVVMEKFDSHFVIRRNVIYERAVFNSREQEECESVETFITALYALAEHCNFGLLHDELIRDRIVVGVRDRKLSEKLQLDNALTLEKAVLLARQSEAIKRQLRDLDNSTEGRAVDLVASKTKGKNKPNFKFTSQDNQHQEERSWQCRWCSGRARHKKTDCPANGENCNNCGKKGHFARACLSKVVKQVIAHARESNSHFLGAVSAAISFNCIKNRNKRWLAEVSINEVNIKWKLDPGADVTTIPFEIYQQKLKRNPLLPSDQTLCGPSNDKLQTMDMFQGELVYLQKRKFEAIYVVKGLTQPLLGLSACEDLGLVKRINQVGSQTNINPEEEFATLFIGLGTINEPYDIKLQDNAIPFALHTPRRVPLPLLERLKNQLNDMVSQGVIEQVDKPTDWCAPMVITSKKNGDIRVCVDLTHK